MVIDAVLVIAVAQYILRTGYATTQRRHQWIIGNVRVPMYIYLVLTPVGIRLQTIVVVSGALRQYVSTVYVLSVVFLKFSHNSKDTQTR